jgi:hypothetical protein
MSEAYYRLQGEAKVSNPDELMFSCAGPYVQADPMVSCDPSMTDRVPPQKNGEIRSVMRPIFRIEPDYMRASVF